jgi:aquaporin Z
MMPDSVKEAAGQATAESTHGGVPTLLEKEIEGTPPIVVLRIVVAELLGTWALVTVAAGGGVINTVSGGQISLTARVVAPALMVAASIYVLGPISGAHYNPVVTLAFALRGDFPWRFVPVYWIIQLSGAVLAALILKAIFGDVGNLGETIPHYGVGNSLVMEIILTFILVTIVLGTASDHKVTGPNAALAVGATIAMCGLFAAPISGASMNPARSLGPAIVSWNWANQWIYVVGPTVGAILIVIVSTFLRGRTTQDAIQAGAGLLAKQVAPDATPGTTTRGEGQ